MTKKEFVDLYKEIGKFEVVDRAERETRNPQTGKMMKVPAKKVVKFKPGKALAEKVNK